jgi:hypothetical protein
MKAYKITDLALTTENDGYNVFDFFSESPADLVFDAESDAQEWLEENYLGADEDGIGVTWEITETEAEITEWRCTDGIGSEEDITADSAKEAAQEYGVA